MIWLLCPMIKQSIFQREVAENIIGRISAITPDTPRQWGTMNATEMLQHCNLANEFILQGTAAYIAPNLKQRFVKFLAMKVLPRFPKNHKGPKRVDVRGKVDIGAFQSYKQTYINIMRAIPQRNLPVTSFHPSMGYLSHEEWGVIIWMHMDHHLRQFGL